MASSRITEPNVGTAIFNANTGSLVLPCFKSVALNVLRDVRELGSMRRRDKTN